MKRFLTFFLVVCFFGGAGILWAQLVGQSTRTNITALNPYAIAKRDGNSRVWTQTTYETAPDGKTIPHLYSYTELATGLNYKNALGQWVPSQETIAFLPDGSAAALQGQHKAYFPADIYNGVIKLVTPDGQVLQSQPAALSYDDGSNTILIAVLTNSIGYLSSSNQVIYPNAFAGVNADLRYTYKRSGFEQDIILREQPPTPESLGLDLTTAKLQILTEFFNAKNPVLNSMATSQKTGLSDTTLTFGGMKMVQGKAFVMGDSAKVKNAAYGKRTSVYKSWQQLQGRTFLVEEVPVLKLADDLEQLPASTSITRSSSRLPLNKIFSTRVLPPQHLAQVGHTILRLAKSNLNLMPGLVLDYNAINSDQTDYTFYSGQTYLISGLVNLNGTTTIQGGAVLKFNGGCLSPGIETNPVAYPTDPANPAILTSADDNSVGEPIGSGTPVVGSDTYISIREDSQSTTCLISNICIFYAGIGIQDSFVDGYVPVVVSDSQFINCNKALDSSAPEIVLNNVLFSGCQIIAGQWNAPRDIQATYLTADNCGYFIEDNGASGGNLELTNSILSNVTNMTTFDNVFYYIATTLENSLIAGTNGRINIVWSQNSSQISSAAGLYTTAGNANYYLAPSSPYRNVGTTAIDSGLLAEIQTMTTYAPQDGGFLDTDTPDLGYHYSVNEDSDFDGLPDWWEIANFGHVGVNPNGDPDGDGLSNSQEYLLGTNPNNSDTDGDGISDSWEVLLGMNPLINDSAQTGSRFNYTYTLAGWLNGVSGIKTGAVNADNEGNVLQVSQ